MLNGPAGSDYATDVFNDPWDYNNIEDLVIFGGAPKFSGLRFDAGSVKAKVAGTDAYLSLVWGGYPTSVLAGRDGHIPANRINAAKYDGAYLRIYSGAPAGVTRRAYFNWFDCPTPKAENTCGGRSPMFALKPGWNTYVIPLGARESGAVNWKGRINSLRLVFKDAGSDIAIDEIRLFDRHSGQQITVDGLNENTTLAWKNAAGTTGTLPPEAKPSRQTAVTGSRVDLSFLPAGTYQIGVKQGTAPVRWQRSVLLDSPRPALITPNAVGDKDYATTVLRNRWDMASAADISSKTNAAVTFSGGKLRGKNAGPTWNDPSVSFRIGAAGIDGSIYHNLTIVSSYTGPYGLANAPGGGSMGRFMWRMVGKDVIPEQVISHDVITFPGTRTITFDLNQPASALIDPTSPRRYSFTGGTKVATLRWDPNEDPATGASARSWTVDDVQLRSDFTADGSFPITWKDANYRAGGKATVSYSKTKGSCAGKAISSGVPVTAGTNTTVWNTRNLAAGRYYVCLKITRNHATVTRPAAGVIVVRHQSSRPAAPKVSSAAPVTKVRSGTATVTFKAGSGKITGYQLQETKTLYSRVLSASARTTAFACGGLRGTASFKVRSYGPGGVSAWSKAGPAVRCP
ncbi:hypothetical protein D1871_14010 [Nakamurella silvestris]|nr:hypothetical protein D1871_14010 [Nakamurella silvestris]